MVTNTTHENKALKGRYWDGSPKVRKRLLRIHKIRDLVAEPLTPAEYLRRPYVRRSRWLILATEHGKLYPQHFYVGCTTEFRAPSQLRVGLYEPEAIRPKALILRPFEPTMHDRDTLRRWLHRYADKDFNGLLLRVFADDMRLLRVS